MKLTKKEIKKIIDYEIVVDCYSEEEANMGWAIYMEENINYPFEADCLLKKKNGKKEWKRVNIISNETNESSFGGGEYYVEMELDDIIILGRIDKLKNVKADKETLKTLQIWGSRKLY